MSFRLILNTKLFDIAYINVNTSGQLSLAIPRSLLHVIHSLSFTLPLIPFPSQCLPEQSLQVLLHFRVPHAQSTGTADG